MTRTGQLYLLGAILAAVAGLVGIITYGLRDEVFPVDVGAKAPNFEVVTLFDRNVKSLQTDYRGRVVLLNVWASWCGPCRIEMPSLQALYQEFGPKGLSIVAVNTADPDASDSVVRRFADGYGLTFDILRDIPASGQDSITKLYKVRAFPESFVIDKNGIIRKKWISADDWNSRGNRSLIASLLGVPIKRPPDSANHAPLADTAR